MSTAIHWSGPLLVCGAVLLGLSILAISFKPVVNQPLSPGLAALLLLSAAVLLVSLPGMYAAQADAIGLLGLAGHVLLEIGVLLLVVLAATPLLYPTVTESSGENVVVFVLGIALTVGLLLTGVATLQAGVFPRAASILLLAATAGFFFVFFVAEFLPAVAGQLGSAFFGILLALGFAWIGTSLWGRG
jgi:hypothetical protein